MVLWFIDVGLCGNVRRKKLNFPLNGEPMLCGRKHFKLIRHNQRALYDKGPIGCYQSPSYSFIIKNCQYYTLDYTNNFEIAIVHPKLLL